MTNPSQRDPVIPEWIVRICDKVAPEALELAQYFLYAGLLFGVLTAVAEAIAALRGPAGRGAANPRVLGTGLQAVVAALSSLLTALKEAKAWLALVIVGILLLWIAASAPDLCLPEEYRPHRPEAAQPQGQPQPQAPQRPGGTNAPSQGQAPGAAPAQRPATPGA